MKKGFTTFLSALKANTPPCKKGLSSRKFLSLFLIIFLAVGNAWGQETVKDGVYTKQTISADGKSSTWTFKSRSSQYSVQKGTDIIDNEMRFVASGNGKIKFQTSSYLSCSANSSIYIPIPSGSDGTISMSPSSSSDTRFFQLYIANQVGAETQRLYSKLNAGGITADGKKGPQSFNFEASDITELDGQTYLRLIDNNTEMKVASFTIVLMNGSYLAPSTTYTVTYDANGGVGEDVVVPDATLVAECSFTYEGKDFVEWNTKADGTGESYAPGDAVTDNLNLYAIWQAETPKYAVTYDLNGGTSTLPTQPSVSEGATVTLAEAPTWEGYRFDGWLVKDENDNDVPVADGKFTMPAAKVTITAQWVKVWTVTFNTNGGSAIAPVVVDNNGTLTAPTAPTKDCYAFGEWQKDGVAFEFATPITSDITLTATWIPKYASTLDFAAVTKAGTTGANPIGTFLASGNMVASNLGGDSGWETSTAKSGFIGYKLKNTNAVVKFLVKEGKEVEITLGSVGAAAKLNKGGVESEIAKKSGDNEQTVIPAFVAESDMLITITTNASSNSTVTLKKISIVDPAPKYTVTYALNGATGTTPTEVSHKEGEKFNLHDGATGITAPTNKTFINWKDQDDNEFTGGAEYTMPGKNVTLTAQWAGDVYTVKFMDGENVLDTKVVEVGSHPADIEHPTKPLYTFAAWQLSGSDVKLDEVSGTKDDIVTLTARWAAAYASNVNFKDAETQDLGVETALNTYHYASNASDISFEEKGLKIKTNAARFYFNVAPGKVAEIKFGNISGATYSVDGGVAETLTSSQLKATYSASAQSCVMTMTTAAYNIVEKVTIHDPYTVTFNANGGDDIAAVQGKPSITLPEPTNGTMNFKGWYDAATEGNKIGDAGEEYTPTADVTIYAQWETVSTDARLASITLSSDAGTLSPAFDPEVTNYTYTMPYGMAAVPTITGATSVSAKAKEPQIISQASAWGETAVIRGVAESNDTKAYNITMLRAPKDGVCLVWADVPADNTLTYNATNSKFYAESDVTLQNSNVKGKDGSAPSGKKFQSNGFLKIALNKGTFLEGDVVALNVTYGTANVMHVFKAQAATSTDVIGEAAGNTEVGLNKVAITEDAATLWLVRGGSYGNWNPHVDYVAVYRAMNPVLTAITFDGVAGVIDEANNKKVTVELPFSSDVASMDVEPTIAWNAPAATNAIVVNDGSGWVIDDDNTYVLTDKDGDQTTYTITLTQAAASADATLKTLTIKGNALTLVDGVYEYDYELPYGTTTAPEVEAEANDANANAVVTSVSLTEAVITVTAENGTTTKVYRVHFTVSRAISYVIYDGSVQESIEESGTGLINWSLTEPSTTAGADAKVTCNDKYYTKCVKVFSSATKETDRYMTIEVPTGYMAKFYLAGASNSTGNERSLFISKQITGTLDKSIVYSTSSTYEGAAMMSDYQMPGTYYLCSNASIRLYELCVLLYPIDYERPVRQGYYGTICLPNGGVMVGAAVYEIAYMDYKDGAPYKIYFDEILNGKMEAGVPYVFLPNEGYNQLMVTYTAIFDAPAKNANGLYGFIGASATDEYKIPGGAGNYIIQNNQYREVLAGADARIVSNRAYIKLSEVPGYNNPLYVAPEPAPGRKRVAMGTTGTQVATGVDQVQGDEVPTKMIINGQLFILRGEKMYDAQGKLVR